MKRKLFATITLFAALALTACGGGGKKEHVHKAAADAEWQSNTTQHWKDCKDNDGGKVDAGSHSFQRVEAESSAATCGAAGVEVKQCTVCGYKVTTNLDKLEHNFVDDGGATGKVHPEKCNSGCNTKAYRFDISEAEGWNSATVKWNAKSTDSDPSKTEATWALEAGQLPAGKYKVYLEALMSYTSHGNRYMFNENKTLHPTNPVTGEEYPDQSSQNPDGEGEAEWRYYFGVNGGENIYPNCSVTLGELGYEGSNDSGTPKFAEVLSEITIPEGATSFSARHGDIGYSLIVSRVRLVKIA